MAVMPWILNNMYNATNKNMKLRITKWLVFASAIVLGIAGLESCVKSRGGLETDFSNLQDYVIFQTGGTGNFGSANVAAGAAAPDTVVVSTIVTLASKNVASSPIVVTIGLDDTKRTDYNSANGTSYQAFPDSIYKILTPTVTIPAGQNFAKASVEIFARKVDQSVSYLLPLTIKDAGGKNLSGNENTVYYHIIGNPLAGAYTWDFYRFNSSDTTTAPAAGSLFNQSITVSPSSATAVLLPDSYLQIFVDPNAGITLSFTNTAGVLSNFKVSLDANTKAGLTTGGFTIASNPVLVGFTIVGNASTRYAGSTFRTYMSLVNSTGGVRTLIDNFVKK
jgi:Domain of unknown function (DUF1735)